MSAKDKPTEETQRRRSLTSEEVARYRKRLLDLSGRNHLISFHHSDRSRKQIRAIDEVPDYLWEKLDLGKRLEFMPLSMPDLEPEDEKISGFRKALAKAKREDPDYLKSIEELGSKASSKALYRLEHALRDKIRVSLEMPPVSRQEQPTPEERSRQLGFEPNLDLSPTLGDQKESKHSDNLVQTLLFDEDLALRLRGISEYARLTETETGVNTLHFAFGFLEWYESKSSDEPILSPLLLYPTDMVKELKGNQFHYYVESRDEDALTNLPLRERLSRDFGIVLPDFVIPESDSDKGDGPESYFQKVNDAIQGQQNWKVRRYLTLSFFSFAKIVMYKDLDIGQKETFIDRLTNLFATEQETDDKDPIDYDIDSLQLSKEIPVHIADADSSQLSALIDVQAGKNLVIEGPPGTGKSQTITNIIASALASNKSILFIAEKLAALQVVKNRLDDSGIGDFCLELHSNKTRKTEVLRSLDQRLKHGRTRRNYDLGEKIKDRDQCKARLNEYVDALQKVAGKLGHSVHQVLGKCAKLYGEADGLKSRLEGISVPNAISIGESEVQNLKALLRTYAELASELLDKSGAIADFQWYPFTPPGLGIVEQDALKRRLQDLEGSLRTMQSSLERIVGLVGSADHPTFEHLKRLLDALKNIDGAEYERPDLLSRLNQPDSRRNLHRLLMDAAKLKAIAEELNKWFTRSMIHHGPETAQAIDTALQILAEQNVGHQNCAELLKSASDADLLSEKCAISSRIISRTFGKLEITSQATVENSRILIKAAKVASLLPASLRKDRYPSLVADSAQTDISSFEHVLATLRERRQKVERMFGTLEELDAGKLDEIINAINSAGIFGFFKFRYWKARNEGLRLMQVPAKISIAELVTALRGALTAIKATREFVSSASNAALLGPRFNGLETDITVSREIAVWAGKVKDELQGAGELIEKLRALLLSGPVSALETFGGLAEDEYVPTITETLRICLDDQGVPLESVGLGASSRAKEQRALANGLLSSGFRPEIPLLELHSVRAKLTDLATVKESAQRNSDPVNLIEKNLDDEKELATLKRILAYAEAISNSPLSSEHQEALFHAKDNGLIQAAKEWASGSGNLLRQLYSQIEAISKVSDTRMQQRSRKSLIQLSLGELIQRVLGANLDEGGLSVASDFVTVEEDLRVAGLDPLLLVLSSEKADLSLLDQAFDLALFRDIAESALKQNPSLEKFSGLRFEELRRRFALLDRQCLQLQRDALAGELYGRNIPQGVSVGKASERSELGLVQHEIGKKRRHIPLRELLHRSGQAIQAMKPCFMMSPLSVAQFLKPELLSFDLVVMDEASQLRPEDALGAIVRARQIVVVGDSQQLPPSNFFSFSDNNDNEDDIDDETGSFESILELPKSWRRRSLRWHYRSKHESLIAFSNRQFYRDDLIVFPSPLHNEPSVGLRYEYVKGCYEGRRNLIEAKRVIEAVKEHASLKPEHSLGIVAINQQQRDLIDELLDEAVQEDPVLARFRAKWEKTLEPLFVKNLENVQGDERDEIFISTVYGFDREGNFFQRFGPINGPMGYRRLNVLFTRSKYQMRVFTSMDPDQIRADETSSAGLRSLKGFLRYARDRHLDGVGVEDNGRQADSDLELDIYWRLKQRGHEVSKQIGVAGYYIDLAIRHPSKPGLFALGIECDGATYHSGRSARDRDRLRQDIIERLGWRVHRIWSVDWFKNPSREIERVERSLADAIKA